MIYLINDTIYSKYDHEVYLCNRENEICILKFVFNLINLFRKIKMNY